MQALSYYWEPWESDGCLYIPDWCYEDTPIEYDDVMGTVFIRKIEKDGRLSIDKEKYRDIRRTSYFACRWYPELIAAKIPTVSSIISRTSPGDVRADLKELMMNNPDYRFVRLCGSSPKDVVQVPIFRKSGDAADAIYMSQRTLSIMMNYDHCHLFIRRVVPIHNECRCFIHKRILRAVSVYNDEINKEALETSVETFFAKHGIDLPYNSCVAEIGWTNNSYTDPFLIEFNSFGVDGFAGGSLFDWHSEQPIMYLSERVVFRYPEMKCDQ